MTHHERNPKTVAHRLLYSSSMTNCTERGERIRATGRFISGRGNRRGFTLVELAVVVAIVGILSVIAVVSYRKLTSTAKVTEATNTISAIKLSQEHYFDLKSTYATTSGAWCPSAGTAQTKTAWTSTCGSPIKWESLAPHVDSPLQFGYKTAGGDGRTVAFADQGITWVNWTNQASQTKPWYVIWAQADLDTGSSTLTELAASNASNQIYSRNVGE